MKNNYVKCHFSLTKDFFFFTFSSQQFDYDMSAMAFFFFASFLSLSYFGFAELLEFKNL